MKPLLILSLLLPLAACGNETSSSLNDAANQSDPAAAQVLRNEAAALEANGAEASLSDPNSPAQQALENAGDAAAAAPQAGNAVAPPSTGAKPHAAADPVPPPQVSSDK